MNIKTTINTALTTAILWLVPVVTFAQEAYEGPPEEILATSGSRLSSSLVITFILFTCLTVVLSRAWTGIMNVSMIEEESLSSIEKRQPYLPSTLTVICSLIGTAIMFALSVQVMGGIPPFQGEGGWIWAAVIFTCFALGWAYMYIHHPEGAQKYLFSFIMGTILTFVMIGFNTALLEGRGSNPFLMAMAVVCIYSAWKFLFGPWRPQVKAMVLGTFLFWVGLHLIFSETPDDRFPRLLAMLIAFVPAFIWCCLFLEYHKQRKSLVLLMFFAGMMSTAPILFYDSLARHSVELDFFLFKLIPQSFIGSTNALVFDHLSFDNPLQSRVISTLIAFMIVGIIEELSKFWVLKNSGELEFTSIDDVMQLAIIVAIGFAFAENVLNPTYFLAFIKDYLVRPDTADWSGFIGNILGRSVLTNMVHIVSTGVLGYFYGYALFSRPYLRDVRQSGKRKRFLQFMQRFFQIPENTIFRREMMTMGIGTAFLLHGCFNFIVTLPDILPGNPRTLGQIFNASDGSFLHYIAILMVPSLFYVVGGFWLLSTLFYKKETMKERGHIVRTDTFIQREMAI